jgi:hypothetical protein
LPPEDGGRDEALGASTFVARKREHAQAVRDKATMSTRARCF